MFAILDVESTGGKFNEEAIIEIAIYKFYNGSIVDQFFSLVKPDRSIQSFVIGLTGINEKMLKNSPKFFEIAKRIVEITSDCILVGHNVEFDYRILKIEFKRIGYNFKRKSLCTVQLSKRLIPNLDSYKLVKLTKAIGIPITSAHRAKGDALATVKLFELLIQKDKTKTIINTFIKNHKQNNLKNKFLKIIDSIPSEPGVYYIYNNTNIIYIGKTKNLKKRITSHFISKQSKAIKIQNQVEKIHYDIVGSELIALLKEQQEIKENQPVLNHRLKYRLFPIGVRLIINTNKYLFIKTEKIKENKKYFFAFKNKTSANKKIKIWIKNYNLCENLTSLSNNKTRCFQHEIKKCKGACCLDEKTNSYNSRVNSLENNFKFKYNTFIVTDSGRNINEKSFVFVEDRKVKGFGYYELNHQIKSIEKIKARLIEIDHNQDAFLILYNFIKKYKNLDLINLQI